MHVNMRWTDTEITVIWQKIIMKTAFFKLLLIKNNCWLRILSYSRLFENEFRLPSVLRSPTAVTVIFKDLQKAIIWESSFNLNSDSHLSPTLTRATCNVIANQSEPRKSDDETAISCVTRELYMKGKDSTLRAWTFRGIERSVFHTASAEQRWDERRFFFSWCTNQFLTLKMWEFFWICSAESRALIHVVCM